MSRAKLPAKQQAFVNEYLKSRNASEAYKKVYGGTDKAARANGARLIANDNVAAAIAAVTERVAEKTAVTVEWIVESAREVALRCMQKVPVMTTDLDDDGKRVWVQETAMVEGEDGETREEGVWQFDSSGAMKALTLLSKHTGGFSDKIEHSGTVRLEDILSRSRGSNP